MGWIQVGARDLTRWVEPVTRDTAKQRVAQGEEANQSNQAFQFPNSFCKHTGIEAHGCIRRLQPNKNLGELIISSRFWKMLPSVNLIPLPHGEGVLTHKEESVLFLNQRKRIKKKKKRHHSNKPVNVWQECHTWVCKDHRGHTGHLIPQSRRANSHLIYVRTFPRQALKYL